MIYSNVDVVWGVGLVKGVENDFVMWGNVFDDRCVGDIYIVEFKEIIKKKVVEVLGEFEGF